MDVTHLATLVSGKFLVVDGPDGGGKSTQIRMLADGLREAGVPVVCCRDPGGTEIGDRIRSVLLDYDLTAMAADCEALLFMASRAQLVAEVIRPALSAGKTVLCDRFVTATCAYQGAAGCDPTRVIQLAEYAIGDCWPDATVILDVPAETGFDRINGRYEQSQSADESNNGHDAMEARSLSFHRDVREGFLRVDKIYPRPVFVVNAHDGEAEVFAQIVEGLTRVLA